jgi:hypothetical protein
MSRIDEKYVPVSKVATPPAAATPIPKILAAHSPSDLYAPRTAPGAAKVAPKSKAIPAWMRTLAGGSAEVDRDGQVLNPSAEQRSISGRLNGMFPRGPGV